MKYDLSFLYKTSEVKVQNSFSFIVFKKYWKPDIIKHKVLLSLSQFFISVLFLDSKNIFWSIENTFVWSKSFFHPFFSKKSFIADVAYSLVKVQKFGITLTKKQIDENFTHYGTYVLSQAIKVETLIPFNRYVQYNIRLRLMIFHGM